MYRTTLRTVSRTAATPIPTLRAAPRRLAHTAVPADRHRSWKSSLARWGLAAGGVWYYTTSDVFADSPACRFAQNMARILQQNSKLTFLRQLRSPPNLGRRRREPTYCRCRCRLPQEPPLCFFVIITQRALRTIHIIFSIIHTSCCCDTSNTTRSRW